ncbi:ABC transporter substrate-binding protein [Cellulomonas dongxiuzhuiae]|uniref:ABC transporter substrate-binding protein n=1 Tax=Cellulomonas dongxiuzhuiae TaxID=2819979 RepID=A0ABX8GHQ5_9CELL|nr:ABC transporter substrate-binding protein [Cellulomonas dongxiuzhuiae]MBO3088218.1 ABC transporter substrate-binding protein [Cellulomonas dongxiuzhuiae]MBO3094435.1 ABC transporter substrate-binding protein [Cellulomonas dongxiuzhuiae]QWC15460.1 ABC transporter substrate-binding protein [Cellulomonas dongxiuzhuiae]
MQRHTPRGRAHLALAAVAALTLAGCTAGSAGGAGGAAGDSTDGPATGGTLTVANSFVVKNLDPAQVYEATGAMAVHAMYDTLVTFEGSDVSDPQPLLAESWESNDDATEFTFTLRDDVVFSDGSELTADDVVFSLNRLVNLKGSPSVTVQGFSASSPQDGVVVVTTETPNPNVPTILAMPATSIVNAETARANGATDAADAAESDSATSFMDGESIGSGPYVLDAFDPASEIVLTANPEYWGEAPAYERIVIQNVEAQNQKMSVERAGRDFVALDLSGRMLEDLGDELQVSSTQDTFYFLTLHQDPAVSEITSNLEFVRALRASIDYEGLAALFGSEARPAAGMVPTAFAGALPESESKAQDLDAAKQHLAASGVADPSVTLMFPAMTYRGVDLATIATKVQNDAAQAGITVQLDPQPIASFLDAQTAGKVAFRFSPQSLNYPVASSLVNNFHPGQTSAERTGWTLERATPEAVAAGDRVRAALDTAEQDAAMQDWQRVLDEDGPYIPLAYNSGVVVSTSDLVGADYSPAGWQVDLRAVARR